MKRVLFFPVAALLTCAPALVLAQDEAAPSPAAELPDAREAPPADQDSLRVELQALKHEIKAMKAEQAEREAAAAMAQVREQAESERPVRIYGFGDFGISRTIEREDSLMRQSFPRPLSFYLGRLNLYFDAKPDPDFRVLVETRLSLYPSGSSSGVSSTGQIQYTSTTVADTSSSNPWAQTSWGSIILERAVVDWTRFQLFSVRAGLFLTPFGIYNVDHGSPTIISISMPTYLTLNWIPQRQIGIQLFGSYPIDRWEVGYAATVANGQTPDGVRDVDDSKAFGGRLYLRRIGELQLLLGASALYRPYHSDASGYAFGADGSATYNVTRIVENQQLTVGVDQSIDYAGLRIRNELAYYQVEYTPGKRETFMGSAGQVPDTRQFNWSFLLAYRYWKLEPYVALDHFRCSPTYGWSYVWHMGAGLNIHLRPRLILKTAWARIRFYRDDLPDEVTGRMTTNNFNALLVWAF